MKALFLVHGFPPSQHSGTFRSAAFARYLPEFGIEPLVICAADEPDVLEYRSSQALEEKGPARVLDRVDWKLKASSRTPVQRVLRRLPLGWTIAQRRQYRAILEAVLPSLRWAISQEQPDILYASSPPPAALLIAERASRDSGIPFVADVRDPWSHYSWARYRHYVDFVFERALERRVLRRAAAVLANTPTARKLMLMALGLPEDKVRLLMNGYDEADFAGLEHPSAPKDTFDIVYTGILSRPTTNVPSFKRRIKSEFGLDYAPLVQDPSTRSASFFLKAMADLLEKKPELKQWLRVQFVGAFDAETYALFEDFLFPDVLRVVPPVSKRQAIQFLAQADLCLLLQIEMKWRGRDFCTSIPAKLFDYLRSGTPILAPMQRSDATDLINQFGAGIVVPPRDTTAIAGAVEAAVRAWLDRGRVPYHKVPLGIESYERRRLTGQLASILKDAARR